MFGHAFGGLKSVAPGCIGLSSAVQAGIPGAQDAPPQVRRVGRRGSSRTGGATATVLRTSTRRSRASNGSHVENRRADPYTINTNLPSVKVCNRHALRQLTRSAYSVKDGEPTPRAVQPTPHIAVVLVLAEWNTGWPGDCTLPRWSVKI